MHTKTNLNSFLLTLLGFNKSRTKLQIVLIVLIHAGGWLLLFLLPVFLFPVRINDKNFYARELLDKLWLVVIFYINYLVLIPRVFLKKKYLSYLLLIFLLFTVYLVQKIAVRNYNFSDRNRPGFGYVFSSGERSMPESNNFFIKIDSYQMRGTKNVIPFPVQLHDKTVLGIPRGIIFLSLNSALYSFAFLLLVGGFMRLGFSFIRNQNEKKALENANLNAEVNFLKSQINPHFLFNTLNSIYAQAHSKSENTEHSILRLSELLRYVLYDSGDSKVELAKDLQYVTNYIDLQRMRLSSKITINYSVEGYMKGCMIAPMLLIAFIENAFKHGISYTNSSVINIEIKVFEETLTLLVCNPVVETNSFAGGGLGLKNVTRRLDLLYPDKYLLDIHHNDYVHVVNLKLDLKSD